MSCRQGSEQSGKRGTKTEVAKRDKREERETDGRREKEGLLLTGKCQMLKSTRGGRAAVRKSSFCNHHDEDWIRQGSSVDEELDICMVLSISPQSVD